MQRCISSYCWTFTVEILCATANLENFYLNYQAKIFISSIIKEISNCIFLHIFLYIKLKNKFPTRDLPWKQWCFRTSKKLLSWLILIYILWYLLIEHAVLTELDSFAQGSRLTHIIEEMPDNTANLSCTSETQRETLHFAFFSPVWGQGTGRRRSLMTPQSCTKQLPLVFHVPVSFGKKEHFVKFQGAQVQGHVCSFAWPV